MSGGGYHHNLGTNIWSTGPTASADDARLLEWELMVPADADIEAEARNFRDTHYPAEKTANGVAAADPWGTRVHIRPEH